MRIRVVLRPPPRCDPEPQIFSSVLVDRRRSWFPLLSSVVAHILVLTMVSVLADHRSWFESDNSNLSAYTVEPIRLRVPDPIYFRREVAPNRPADRQRPPGKQIERPAAANGSPATGAVPRRRFSIPGRLELPSPLELAAEAPVILQPEVRVQPAPPKIVVPPLAFWARQGPDLPKPPRGQVLAPGRTEAPSPPPRLDAPPVLAVPNRQPVAADINLAMPQPQAPPALPVPNSATAPIRLRGNKGESPTASFDPLEGQPVNVIALSADRVPANEVVKIPRGLQNVPRSEGDPGPPGSGANVPAVPNRQTNRAPASHEGQKPSGPTTAAAGANGPASAPGDAHTAPMRKETPSPDNRGNGTPGASASDPTEPRAAANSVDHPGAATRPPLGDPIRDANAAAAAVTRIVHPANGAFDVVIMQSAARDDLPEIGGILSGSPVYTVYLRVGDQREWLLEYCLPSRGTSQTNPYQVDIDDAAGLSPPYPLSTVIPNSILGQQHSKHTVLHGFLGVNGSLRDVKATDAGNALASQILPFLSQWQFRPALRNKQPIDVEVLLVVPPRS